MLPASLQILAKFLRHALTKCTLIILSSHLPHLLDDILLIHNLLPNSFNLLLYVLFLHSAFILVIITFLLLLGLL